METAFDIKIPSWQNINHPTNGKHTLYLFVVSYNGRKWTIKKRYSECLNFYETLTKNKHVSVPFPSKTLLSIGNFEVSFLEKRRAELEHFFRSTSHLFPGYSAALSFFGVDNPDLDAVVRSKIATYTKSQFVPSVWPPPLLPRFPPSVVIDGSKIFVRSLLADICDIISDLQRIEANIHKSRDLEQRITILDETKIDRTRRLSELDGCLGTLRDLIQSAPLESQLMDTMVQINDVAGLAISWAANVEEQLLSSVGKSELRVGDLQDRLATLQKQTEVSLALLVSSQSEVETKNAQKAIQDLMNIIKTDMELSKLRKQTELYEKLDSLRSYLAQALSSAQNDPSSSVSESSVAEMEESLFQFIDDSSRLDTDDLSEAEQISKAEKLMAQMEELRSSLAKSRIALEKNGDVSHTNFLNRIGDMQENLVEIQYQVKSKFLTPEVSTPAAPSKNINYDPFEL